MKKLGFVIIMALVLTIGGVYATFNYAQNDVDPVNATLTKTIAGTDITKAKGTITIDVETFQLKKSMTQPKLSKPDLRLKAV